MDRSRRWITAVLMLAVAGLGGWWSLADETRGEPAVDAGGAAPDEAATRGPRQADPGVEVGSSGAVSASGAEVVVDEQRGALIRTVGLPRAGSRSPRAIEPSRDGGLRCPDGRCLPLLNGVAAAPALLRAPEHGPLPPVVAVLVDADGWDWYEHADGSITTTRPQFVTDAQGRRSVQVVTVHNAPGTAERGPAELPPDVGPTRR